MTIGTPMFLVMVLVGAVLLWAVGKWWSLRERMDIIRRLAGQMADQILEGVEQAILWQHNVDEAYQDASYQLARAYETYHTARGTLLLKEWLDQYSQRWTRVNGTRLLAECKAQHAMLEYAMENYWQQ